MPLTGRPVENIFEENKSKKDWIFFLFTISVVNSIYYIVISYVFKSYIDYRFLLTNNFATFLIFFLFYYIFDIYYQKFFGKSDV